MVVETWAGVAGISGQSLSRGLAMARREIREGRFQRSMAVVTAFAAIVSGFEAYIQHQRGAFANPLMWTPIWLMAPTAVVAGAVLLNGGVAGSLLMLVSAVALLDGVAGFALHIRGVRRLPGGFKLGQYNVVMGPPLFAPLLLCTVGILGLFAALLRGEVFHLPGRDGGLTTKTVGALSSAVGRHPVRESLAAEISHGRFQRTMASAAAFLTVLAGGEVYFEHLRGSFNQRLMWIPVWVSLPMTSVCLAAVCSRRFARGALRLGSAAIFLAGVLGFALHLRGIWRMPGRMANLRFNITMGPPLFAPLLFSAAGLLGFIASLLRREGQT